jgi:hypothetical protein
MLLFLDFWLPVVTVKITALGVALKTLNIITLAAAAAFAGWKLGEWIENNTGKIQKFEQRIKSLWDSIFHKPKGPVMEFGWGKPEALAAPFGETPSTPSPTPGAEPEQIINLVERHAQKLKELNDEYLTGQINAQKYYEEIKKLHEDGLDIKQEEMDLLNQSIELERTATDAEYQRIYVMGEGISTAQEYARVKAEMANQDLVDQQNTLNAATNLLRTLQSMHITIWQGIFDFINMGIQKFSTGFSTALTSIIMGTKKASEAFKEFGMSMLTAIVEFFVQWGVQALIAMTIGKLLSALVIAEASAIAAAWLPAAIFASIATMGGADVAGAAGMAMATGAGMALFAGMKGALAASTPALTTLGEGGIVTQPTLALIGERGPEMVTPLDKAHSFRDINIILDNVRIASDMDIRELAEKLGENVKDEMKRP